VVVDVNRADAITLAPEKKPLLHKEISVLRLTAQPGKPVVNKKRKYKHGASGQRVKSQKNEPGSQAGTREKNTSVTRIAGETCSRTNGGERHHPRQVADDLDGNS